MQKLALTSLAVLLLAVPAAHAKEVSKATVCGANGCEPIEDRAALGHLDGDRRDPPSGPAASYRIRIEVRGDGAFDRFSIAYVPSARAFRTTGPKGEPQWIRLEGEGLKAFNAAVRGIEPLPAAKLGDLGEPIPTPKVRVDEVVLPPEGPAEHGGFPWLPTLVAVGALGAGAALLRRLRRRPFRLPSRAPSGSS